MSRFTPVPGHPNYKIDQKGRLYTKTGHMLNRYGRKYRLRTDGVVTEYTQQELLHLVAEAEAAQTAQQAPGVFVSCRVCGNRAEAGGPDRLCRACAAAPPPARKSKRKCVKYGETLSAGYWRRCSHCLSGAESGLEIFGVAL